MASLSPTPGPALLSVREAAALVGLYLLSALVLTWPMALDPLGTVVGHPQATVGCHVWVLWWAKVSLLEPLTPLIFHPSGADVVQLYGSDLVSPLLLGRLPLPSTLAYNLWVVFLLVSGPLGLALLARDRGAALPGAALGGLVFQSAPFFLHELLNGTSEILAAGVLSWFTLSLYRVFERPGWRPGLGLGLTTGLAAATSAYNVFFAVLIGCCLLAAQLATRRDVVLSGPVLRSGLVGVATAGCFAVPIAWLQATHGAGATLARREDWIHQDPPLPDSFASLSDWLDPRAADLPALMPMPGGEAFPYWTTCTVYVGVVALGLAALGMVRGRLRGAGALAGAGVVAALLAMGPVLRWDGEVVQVLGGALPLPGVVVAELFPPYVLTAIHSYRYTAVVMLAVGVLAAGAVRRARSAALLGAAVLLEALLVSPVPWPAATTRLPVSPVLQDLRVEGEGAVLTAPSEAENLHDLGRLLLAQTVHGLPVHDGGIHRRAGEESTALFSENPLLEAISVRGEVRLPGPRATAWSLQNLQENGYAHVLVPQEEAEVMALFVDALGEPLRRDERWARWDIAALDLGLLRDEGSPPGGQPAEGARVDPPPPEGEARRDAPEDRP